MAICERIAKRELAAFFGAANQSEPLLCSTFVASLASVACVAEELKNPTLRKFGYWLISVADATLANETDILQAHYYLGATGTFFYRFRKLDDFALERAISTFNRQIQISSDVAGLLRTSSRGGRIAHAGYSHMRVIRETAGELDAARSICTAALEGGWQGDWRGHIRRIDDKLK
jgi:hypothetical protein